MWIQPLGWEDPVEKAWPPTPVFLPGELPGQRSLVGYSLWGHKESQRRTHVYSMEQGKMMVEGALTSSYSH